MFQSVSKNKYRCATTPLKTWPCCGLPPPPPLVLPGYNGSGNIAAGWNVGTESLYSSPICRHHQRMWLLLPFVFPTLLSSFFAEASAFSSSKSYTFITSWVMSPSFSIVSSIAMSSSMMRPGVTLVEVVQLLGSCDSEFYPSNYHGNWNQCLGHVPLYRHVVVFPRSHHHINLSLKIIYSMFF